MHLLTLIAQESDNDGGGGGAAIIQLGILLLIPLAMYFLMIRPQRRRVREQAAMQSDLGVGDEIVTTAGIYGFITGFDEDRVWVEIDDDVQVRIARAAIANKVDTSGRAAPPKQVPPATDETSAETTDASRDTSTE
jgi:preprotein translocase subunit YajC